MVVFKAEQSKENRQMRNFTKIQNQSVRTSWYIYFKSGCMTSKPSCCHNKIVKIIEFELFIKELSKLSWDIIKQIT